MHAQANGDTNPPPEDIFKEKATSQKNGAAAATVVLVLPGYAVLDAFQLCDAAWRRIFCLTHHRVQSSSALSLSLHDSSTSEPILVRSARIG